MPVIVANGKVTLAHPNGSSAEIILYGATLISWRAPASPSTIPIERLYTSRTAALDGSKPVRGGIPIVFPFFGPPTRPEHAALSQHGFARNSLWKHDATLLDDDSAVSVRFVLPPHDPYPSLTYVVTLAAHQLTSALHLTNTSTTPLSFQALLHTYLRADAPRATVSPLQGITYLDKLQHGHPELREERAHVDVRQPADSVYKGAGGKYDVDTGLGQVTVSASGLEDVVVWNPGEAGGKKIADLEDGGWNMFIAVEPGAASYWIELQPAELWTGQQVLAVG